MRRNTERGYALIVTGVCAIGICGALGLAVDIGRLYIVKNEMQTFTDSAALAAAAELDGTGSGVNRAVRAVSANPNRWNLGTASFSGTDVKFGQSATGPWVDSGSAASGYVYVRVSARGTVPLYFLPAVQASTTTEVRAATVAGQIPKTSFNEGLLPFSPFAHSAGAGFGFTPGQTYTLRWPASPKLNANVCPGDNAQQWIDLAQAAGGSERGYIEETSANTIRQAIVAGLQTGPLEIGSTVNMTGGNKLAEKDALQARIGQDSDALSGAYSQYTGNGRRLVAAPINSGPPYYRILGFALFMLLPASQYDVAGNKPWCAEYVGPYVAGGRHQAGGPPGAYAVRLAQ